MKILSVNNLSYSVKDDSLFSKKNYEKKILSGITFSLEGNKILGVTGESGSGKTTLAKILAGIILPSSGTYKIDSAKKNPVQILFQNNGEILNPLRRVDEIIKESVKLHKPEADPEREAKRILYLLNFSEHLYKRRGYELSGGEQQRAALARLLAAEPDLLILDEPFSAQDPESQKNFLNLFLKINEELNITLICIAHNLKMIRSMCSEIIVIYKGEIVEKGDVKEILKNPNHAYTKYLVKAEDYSLSKNELKFEEWQKQT